MKITYGFCQGQIHSATHFLKFALPQPKLANGFRRKRKDDSRESTPVGVRSDTPVSLEESESREATLLVSNVGDGEGEVTGRKGRGHGCDVTDTPPL